MHVINNAEHTNERSRPNRLISSAVVQGNITARNRHTKLAAAVNQTKDGLVELPHDIGIVRGAIIEAISDSHRSCARDSHIPVSLAKSQLGAKIRVKGGLASVSVQGQRDAEVVVNTNHAGIVRLSEHSIATHEPVILVGDPGTVAQLGGANKGQQGPGKTLTRVIARQRVGVVLVELINPPRTGGRHVENRSVVSNRPRIDVDNPLALPINVKSTGVGDLANDSGSDTPMGADLHEAVKLIGAHHRGHPLLGLAHEDLFRGEVRVAQRNAVELDVHATVASTGQLGGGTGDSGGTEILQGLNYPGVEEVKGALDEQLLHERVAHLDAGSLRLALCSERFRGKDRRATDTVATGGRTKENDEIAYTRGFGEL